MLIVFGVLDICVNRVTIVGSCFGGIHVDIHIGGGLISRHLEMSILNKFELNIL